MIHNSTKIPETKLGGTFKKKRWHRSWLAPANTQSAIAGLLKELEVQRAEMYELRNRLAQMEANQKVQQNAYHVPQSLSELKSRQQPPAGMTAMQAIMGKLDVEQTTEELLAQLKALD